MKKIIVFLFVIVAVAFTNVKAQDESTTDKAIRPWFGYIVISGPGVTHSAPTIYISTAMQNLKLHFGVYANSLAWGVYEERGGYVAMAYLLNNPTSTLRYHVKLMATYGARNLIGDSVLPEKMLTVTAGGFIVYDLLPRLSLQISGTVGYGAIAKLPYNTQFKPKESGLAGTLGLFISYKF